MAAPSSEPCLYFVRAWRNQRVTEWIPLPNVIQEHRIRSHELQTATQGLLYGELAPSFWNNNAVYQSTIMGARSGTPSQTFTILKLPVSLVTNLTDKQALDVIRQIESHVIKNLSWSSTELHSIARINHLPRDENGARGFYRKGDTFFRDLKRNEAANQPGTTLGHKYGLGTKQVAQIAPTPTAAPAPTVRRAPPPPPPPAPTPAVARPSRNFGLHKRFGLKGTHPSPDALKQLRKIWNAQKGGTTEPAADVDAPAPTTAPAPAGDEPANN